MESIELYAGLLNAQLAVKALVELIIVINTSKTARISNCKDKSM